MPTVQSSSESDQLRCSEPVQGDSSQPQQPLKTVDKFSPKDTVLASGDQASSEPGPSRKTAESKQNQDQDQDQDPVQDRSAKPAKLDSKVNQKAALRDHHHHLPRDADEPDAHKESLREKGLRRALRELESKQGALKKQLGSVADELAHHKALVEKHKQDNKNLKIDKQAVQLQLSKAQYLIKCQNEIISRQGREVCFHHELLEELRERTSGMQRTIRDLQNQVERMHKEDVLAGFHDLEEEFIFLTKNTDVPHLSKEHGPGGPDGPRRSVKNQGFLGCLALLPVDVATGLCTLSAFATMFLLKTKLNT